MSVIINLISKLSGWKTVIGYLLLQLPLLNDNPMLKGATDAVLSDPSAANLAALVAQLLLAFGVLHRIEKNLREILK